MQTACGSVQVKLPLETKRRQDGVKESIWFTYMIVVQ